MLHLNLDCLQATLKQLDLAIYWHEKWSSNLARTIICRLPDDHIDIAEDAHRRCQFGQWYYGNEVKELHNHQSFVAVESDHAHMHQMARRLILAIRQGATDTSIEYDDFRNALDHLNLEINTLKHEIEDSIHNRDALTGAENRISMLTSLRELHQLAKRGVQECAVVMMDVDHFKQINDNHGHLIGDQILVGLVKSLKAHLRPYDHVYRYGGEEFIISLQNTDLQSAKSIAERMRTGIGTLAIPILEQNVFSLTVSLGIAMLDPEVDVEESISRADTALSAAKDSGRDRVCIWDPSLTHKGLSSPT
jgi:diguanylate cyclase